MKRLVSLCSLALIGVVPASAATLVHNPISCVPAGGNAKLIAMADGAASARVYFKSDIGANEYYVEMLKGPEGFWAILPAPTSQTSKVTYRVVARDSNGNETIPAVATAPVSAACSGFALEPEEQRIASNLVIGHTADDAGLVGFSCAGVTNEITVDGQMKPFTDCEDGIGAVAAALAPTAASTLGRTVAIIGVGAAGATISAVAIDNQNDDRKPVSPILP